MKRLNLNVLLTILVLGLAVVSCKKDKDDDGDGDGNGLELADKSSNHFTYKGKSYDLSKGYLENYGKNDENSADFDISLCSKDLNYDPETEEFDGKGNFVYLDLNSPSLTELESGTYTYDADCYYSGNDEEIRKPNTLVDGEFLIDFDFDAYDGEDLWLDENSTGTVTVDKSGDTYEIAFSIIDSEGEKIEGYYKGSLEDIVYDYKKSKNKKSRN